MILQALITYYEALLKDGKAVPEGWCVAKVAYALNLSKDGSLRGVMPLKQPHEKGKKRCGFRNRECSGSEDGSSFIRDFYEFFV